MELAGPARGVPQGLSLRPAESCLASRARDFLEAGPADVVPLIEHVCQIPGAPRVVAEHMAQALFAERTEFVRSPSGEEIRLSQIVKSGPNSPQIAKK